MMRFFVRIVCCFIPSRHLRHWVRNKMFFWEKGCARSAKIDWKTNHIWLIAQDGTRRSVRSVPNCEFKFSGKNNNVYLYEPVGDVHLSVIVSNHTNITIRSGCSMTLFVFRGNWGLCGNANLVVDEGCKSTGVVKVDLCNANVTIGRDCLFASDITIRTGDYHTMIDNSTGCVLNRDMDVKVGNHVWVTTGAFIGKGVVISDNSIVGAYSVVTHKFNEPNVVIAGVPAKIVKCNVNWDVRSISDYEKSL